MVLGSVRLYCIMLYSVILYVSDDICFYSVLLFYIRFCSILLDEIIRFGIIRLYSARFDYYIRLCLGASVLSSILVGSILFDSVRFYSIFFGSTLCYYVILDYRSSVI